MMRTSTLLVLAVIAGAASPVLAYTPDTHSVISREAIRGSVLNDPATVGKLGLRTVPVDDDTQTFEPSNDASQKNILELIEFGSRWEDESSATQALRHFYDPVNDRALDVPSTASGA